MWNGATSSLSIVAMRDEAWFNERLGFDRKARREPELSCRFLPRSKADTDGAANANGREAR